MAEPIHCLVFTKDRPMQLAAFFQSAARHASYVTYTVCAEQGAAFRPAVLSWIWACDRVVFHTDDEVFYRTPPADIFDTDDAVITLRQGRNTTYCHPLDCEQRIPAGFPRWKWREAEHDFAYPLSLNACVYRTEWLMPLLDFEFTNPTQLECGLANQHMNFPIEYMVAPEHSCTVALPHNRVSSDPGARGGTNPEWQADALLEKYEQGYRLDLDAMDFSNIIGAHQEVPLIFRRD